MSWFETFNNAIDSFAEVRIAEAGSASPDTHVQPQRVIEPHGSPAQPQRASRSSGIVLPEYSLWILGGVAVLLVMVLILGRLK